MLVSLLLTLCKGSLPAQASHTKNNNMCGGVRGAMIWLGSPAANWGRFEGWPFEELQISHSGLAK